MATIKQAAFWLMVGLAGVVLSISYAQDYQVEPEAHRQAYYRVRVVNKMDIPICVKIMPYGKTNYFHADLARNESDVENLWAGQRALCVWDDRTGELLIVARVNINRNGVLRIRPLWGEPDRPGAPAGAAPRAAAEAPAVEIESE